ncbi:MAG: nucleotide exchange factor GrpE [Minisyncoccota bacterium]
MDNDINKRNDDEILETTFEDDVDSAVPERSDAIRKLKEKLEKCLVERVEYLDGWQRARADFANAKRDEDHRRVETVKLAKESLLLDIVPVLDSFEMAMSNSAAWEKVDKDWRKGVEYIYAQLRTVLEKNGITEINPLGKPFDHREQMSVEMVAVRDTEIPDTVVEVVQKGYKLYDKVIRPAQVKVAVGEGKSTSIGAEQS